MPPRRTRRPRETHTCVACDETYTGRSAAIIQGNELCQTCFDDGLRPQFEAYLRIESSPVMWAGQAVEFDAVRHQFSNDFIQRYLERMEEYAVTPRQRVHCQCGKFVGEKTAWKSSAICSSCGGKTCTHCSANLGIRFSTDTLASHACREEQEDDAFEGLQIGRDWQKCPKCETRVELREACNHMTCPLAICRTHFCYICGVEAHPEDGSNHWGYGGQCPLYGQSQPGPIGHAPQAFEGLEAFQGLDLADIERELEVGVQQLEAARARLIAIQQEIAFRDALNVAARQLANMQARVHEIRRERDI